MDKKHKIVYADMLAFDNDKFEGFRIMWGAEGIGFGTFDFYSKKEEDELDEHGEPKYPRQVYCDNECMDKDFVKAVLNKFIDEAKFIDGPDDELTPEQEEKLNKQFGGLLDEGNK